MRPRFYVFTTDSQAPSFLNQQEREYFVECQHAARRHERTDVMIFRGFGKGRLEHIVPALLDAGTLRNLLVDAENQGYQYAQRELSGETVGLKGK